MRHPGRFYDGRLALIDAHGSDHGLYVGYDFSFKTVTIRDWSEFPEANPETGKREAVLREVEVDARELLDRDGKHHDLVGSAESVHDRIVQSATAWLSYYGAGSDGESILSLDDGETPCRYFGNYWGFNKEVLPHMLCALCSVADGGETR